MAKKILFNLKELVLNKLPSKLRYKLMLLLVGAIILPIMACTIITYFSIGSSMQKIDVDKATANLKSVQTYIDTLVDFQVQNFTAWTMWDEFHDAIANKNSDWISQNVLSMTKDNTPNEVLVVLDANANVLGQSNAPIEWASGSLKKFALLKNLDAKNHYAGGVIKTSKGIYVAAIVEVAKSEDEDFKNFDGYTIYARKLSDNLATLGKKIVNVDISLKYDGGVISTVGNQPIDNISANNFKNNEVHITSQDVKDSVKITASQLFLDPSGSPIGVLTAATTSQAGKQALNKLLQFSIILALLVLILSALTMIWINKYVVVPVLKVTDAAEEVGNKNLTVALEVEGKDEIARLSRKFNEMIISQKDVVTKFLDMADNVGDTSSHVKDTSEELNIVIENQSHNLEEFTASIEYVDQGTQDVKDNMSKLATNATSVSSAIGEMGNALQDTAKNVEEAAAAISQVSASMEQMDDSINSIVEHSKVAQSEAAKTVGKAKEGNMAVGYAIQKMDKISKTVDELSTSITDLGQAAGEIGEITNVIDDIASQTNLLSLNAAIEAARAGEYGKGFSVVAESIRVLAKQSSEATQDIAHLVSEIQGKVKNAINVTKESENSVKEGSQYVKGTGKVFEEIYNAINNTGKIISDIAGSILSQKEGSREIVKAVEKLSDLVNQLSATVEQQAAGSDEIVKSVERINELMHSVSSTTEEQAASSQEVVRLIKDINRNSEEVSTSSQGIVRSIEGLSGQAEELVKIVNEYKLK